MKDNCWVISWISDAKLNLVKGIWVCAGSIPDDVIEVIFPAALWFWGRLSPWQKRVPGKSPGGKYDWCVRLTTLYRVPIVMKSGSLKLQETYGPIIGQYRDCCTFIFQFKALSYIRYMWIFYWEPYNIWRCEQWEEYKMVTSSLPFISQFSSFNNN
jgi:hypothetical protein